MSDFNPYAPGRYTPHFSFREMQASEAAARYGIDNAIPEALRPRMLRTCEALEMVRARFGPLRVNSGYRSPRLNTLIGGSTTSAHCRALAVDFVPLDPDVTLHEVVSWLVGSKVDFDQVIFEFGSWVHLGLAQEDKRPRREALMVFRPGMYEAWSAMDPRVKA